MATKNNAATVIASRIGIAAAEYATIARSIGIIDGQRNTFRDDLARTYIKAGADAMRAVPDGAFDPKAFRTMFNSAARDALRAQYDKATVREYDSYDKATLADRLTMHTDRNSAFTHADVADMARALGTLKSRLSESFRLFTMYLDGETVIDGLLDGSVSVYAILDGLRGNKADGGKSDTANDASTDDTDDATSSYDIVKFQARIAAELKRAEKAGFLPDALAKVAEMVGSLATK